MGQAKLGGAEAIAALERNLWSMWSVFGTGEGCRLIDEPGLLRFETPIAHVPYNSVMRFHADDVGADATIDAVLASYAARRAPPMWVVHPSARPADLDVRLAARGLVEAEVVPGMIAPLDILPAAGAPPDGVTIDEVGPTNRDPFLELLTWRYSLPPGAAETLRSVMDAGQFGVPGSPNRAWVARRGRAVLSKVTMHLDGDVAGIYGVATAVDARGLGLARLLTIGALLQARAQGATNGVLHSTPMAVSLYEGLGFEHVCDFRLYAEPGALHL